MLQPDTSAETFVWATGQLDSFHLLRRQADDATFDVAVGHYVASHDEDEALPLLRFVVRGVVLFEDLSRQKELRESEIWSFEQTIEEIDNNELRFLWALFFFFGAQFLLGSWKGHFFLGFLYPIRRLYGESF
jgi:hypothetical protein